MVFCIEAEYADEVRVPSRGGWMSGSGRLGITGDGDGLVMSSAERDSNGDVGGV